jgi:flagellar biosynthesis/type III secretory pathway protein FliH
MNRYIRLSIVGVVFAGSIAGAAYEGTRYGYDTGIVQGEQKGKAEVTDYVTKTCESKSDVMLVLKDKEYFCLTEAQLTDLIQAIAEQAIEQFRKQGGHHGQTKGISST